MKHKGIYRYLLLAVGAMVGSSLSAQSYVTYNHDATKMNQITVQEIGSGGLTPTFYYTAFHNSYQKTASAKKTTAKKATASKAKKTTTRKAAPKKTAKTKIDKKEDK